MLATRTTYHVRELGHKLEITTGYSSLGQALLVATLNHRETGRAYFVVRVEVKEIQTIGLEGAYAKNNTR